MGRPLARAWEIFFGPGFLGLAALALGYDRAARFAGSTGGMEFGFICKGSLPLARGEHRVARFAGSTGGMGEFTERGARSAVPHSPEAYFEPPASQAQLNKYMIHPSARAMPRKAKKAFTA